MNPSAIREILKLTDRPGIISLAGGLPSPKAFPLQEFTAACNTVMARDGAAALQYATSEGYAPLRQAVADMLPWAVDPDQVLITTGSQQALDLIGKVFLDKDSRMLVETPTYLGALQAFCAAGTHRRQRGQRRRRHPGGRLCRQGRRRRRQGPPGLCAAQLPEPHGPHHDRGTVVPRWWPRRPNWAFR